MKTIILPGYSQHNRDWAIELKKNIDLGHEIMVHEWRHWKSPSLSLSLRYELSEILRKIGKDKVNIIAKSVGTRVAMDVVTKIPKQIVKVILCGIPTRGDSEIAKKTYSSGLSLLSPTQITLYQNTKDPFASFSDIKKFIGKINPQIKVVEKPRSDHHYPYPNDFLAFLKS
jgi:pimeloyl-ACP methyl ester carboxylesterase